MILSFYLTFYLWDIWGWRIRGQSESARSMLRSIQMSLKFFRVLSAPFCWRSWT